MKKIIASRSENGFTIIELMIALSVLSTILIMSTVILIQIGALYSKGVNAANLQNTSRGIEADVSSALQFSGNTPLTCPAGGGSVISCEAASHTYSGVIVNSVCIGTTRYSYVLNSEMGTDTAANPITGAAAGTNTLHVLWRDTIKQNGSCQPLDLSVSPVIADASSSDATSGSPSGGYDMVPNRMRLTRFVVKPTASTGNVYDVNVWMALGDSDLVNTDATGNSSCRSSVGSQFCSESQISSTVAGRVY